MKNRNEENTSIIKDLDIEWQGLKSLVTLKQHVNTFWLRSMEKVKYFDNCAWGK